MCDVCACGVVSRKKVDKWWLCDIGDIRPRDLSIVWPPSLQNVGATLLVRGRAVIVHTINVRAGTSSLPRLLVPLCESPPLI
jgi:hypothetical protein